MDNVNKIIEEVKREISRAMEKFPTWPTDPLHALAILNEEVGELQQAALQRVYEPHKSDEEHVRRECIQVAAMALRFMASMNEYYWQPSSQHYQDANVFLDEPQKLCCVVSTTKDTVWWRLWTQDRAFAMRLAKLAKSDNPDAIYAINRLLQSGKEVTCQAAAVKKWGKEAVENATEIVF